MKGDDGHFFWRCRDLILDLRHRTHIMGVLNVTPDSFSDGGDFHDPVRAVERGLAMVEEGADIIDVGGESTRPGSEAVPAQLELQRVVPVVEKLAAHCRCPISIDTTKSGVAEEALAAGARIVNDISGLSFDPDMAPHVARCGAGVVIMHIKGIPRDMQRHPFYENVMAEIERSLSGSMERAVRAGVEREQIVLDPGIGFGKRLVDNLTLIRELRVLEHLGRPIMVGPSRKSFIGQVLNLPAHQRLEGTLAAVIISVINGARIVRVHDVLAVKRAVQLADAILDRGELGPHRFSEKA